MYGPWGLCSGLGGMDAFRLSEAEEGGVLATLLTGLAGWDRPTGPYPGNRANPSGRLQGGGNS